MHISNEMVRLYKEQFGRGPTKAPTNWAGPDVVVTVLEDTLTPAERNLVKLGEHQRLRMAVELFVLHPEGYAGTSRASDLAG